MTPYEAMRNVVFLQEMVDSKSLNVQKKKKVLFFHGEYTNENVAAFLLRVNRYDKLFDFVIPGGLYEGSIVPDKLKDQIFS